VLDVLDEPDFILVRPCYEPPGSPFKAVHGTSPETKCLIVFLALDLKRGLPPPVVKSPLFHETEIDGCMSIV
jgi:hypothetical protein